MMLHTLCLRVYLILSVYRINECIPHKTYIEIYAQNIAFISICENMLMFTRCILFAYEYVRIC